MHTEFKLPISFFFSGLALAATAVAVVSALFVPEHNLTMATATVVMSGRGVDDVTASDVIAQSELAGSKHDGTTSGGGADGDARCGGCSAQGPVGKSCDVMRRHRSASLLIMVFSTVYFQSLMTPTQDMLFYYKTIFDAETSNSLVDLYALLYGSGGFACSLWGGALCDRLGLVRFIVLISCIVLFTTLSLMVRSYTAQIAAQLSIVFGMSLYSIVISRFSMHYCPPELLGTFMGVMFTYVGLMMGVSASAQAGLVALIPERFQYTVPFLVFGCTAAALGELEPQGIYPVGNSSTNIGN